MEKEHRRWGAPASVRQSYDFFHVILRLYRKEKRRLRTAALTTLNSKAGTVGQRDLAFKKLLISRSSSTEIRTLLGDLRERRDAKCSPPHLGHQASNPMSIILTDNKSDCCLFLLGELIHSQ